MAIVVDPDLLNRNEIIFGTQSQKKSAYPVGAVVSGIYDPELEDGTTTSDFSFNSTSGNFIIAGVTAGDILSIKTGADAGHWPVSGVISATELKVQSVDQGDSSAPVEWSDTAGSGIVYDIRDPTGGNMADGATEQAIYSFDKEEWRTDGETYGGDDLIRHEFPFEPLTRESFEIGGGTSHDNWDWFSNDTKERVRTGGWDSVNSSSVKRFTYAGVITLGALDSDAQAYYQPSGVDADPINFVLTGAVNQAVLVHDVFGGVESSGFDTRSFLKLFVRKKAKTYAQSELSDIGVTTLENIVNRFPLTHVDDPAISADDAELEGHDPWTNFSITNTGSNGVTADVDTSTGTFTAAGENFLSTVSVGDVVEITDGTNDNGFYQVLSVDSDTQLTVDTTELGGFTGESSLTYETHTRKVVGVRIDDGAITEITSGSGHLDSIVGGFVASGVGIGDILRILEPGASGLEGAYKVNAINSDTQLGVNTTDQAFPSGTANVIDYEVLEPGMFLQSKDETIALSSVGNLTFADAGGSNEDTIDRSSGSWITDNVQEGDVITISGSTNNDGTYIIRNIISAAQIEVDVAHTLTNEGPVAATATVARHFNRTIDSVIYPFLWRCFGNGATIAEVFEFVQKELRQTSDIDNGPDRPNFPNRGDVTDLLMEFATPTGKGLNMYIDNFDVNDTNNVTFEDASGITRAFSFIAAGTISHNTNLVNDTGPAVVRMFFDSIPTGDFGTKNAVLVNDANSNPISYTVSGASQSFTFDYDNNNQGGRTPATDADIVLVAIGLETAQYVLFEGTITRATGQTFSLISSLERTYSDPS
jgi:hypothetical protein